MNVKRRRMGGGFWMFRLACLGLLIGLVGANEAVAGQENTPAAPAVVDLRQQARKFTALEEAVRKAQAEVEELAQAHARQVQNEMSAQAQAVAEAKWQERIRELEQISADQNQRLDQSKKELESTRKDWQEAQKQAARFAAEIQQSAARQAAEVQDLREKIAQAETRIQQEMQTAQTLREQAVNEQRAWDARLQDPAYVHPGKALREQLVDPKDPSLAWALNDVGLLLAKERRWDEAADLFRRSMAILETIPAGKAGAARGTVQQHLGDMAQAQGDLGAAQKYYQNSADIFRAELGAHHPRYAAALNSLAIVLQDQDRPKEAEIMFRQVVRIYERSTSDQSNVVAVPLYNLAMFMMGQRRMDEAGPLLERAVQLLEADPNGDAGKRAAMYRALIRYYRTVGKPDEAAQCEEKLVDLTSK